MFDEDMVTHELGKAEELLEINPKAEPYIVKSLELVISRIQRFIQSIRSE